MRADQIIKYVNRQYERYWTVDRAIDCSVFSALVQPHLAKPLTDSDYSRLRRPGRTTRALLSVLAFPAVLHRIETALECPGLFNCRNESEIDSLMASRVGAADLRTDGDALDDNLIVPSADRLGDLPLSDREVAMTAQLSAFIQRQKGYLSYWFDPPAAGASLLAYVVASRELAQCGIASYMAHPFSSAAASYLLGSDIRQDEEPYASALRTLTRKLGLPVGTSARAIIDGLLDTNSILFVLSAHVLQPRLQGRTSAMHSLLLEAKSRGGHRQTQCVPIFLVGAPADSKITSLTPKFSELQGRTIQFVANGISTSRSEFFERQWRRYCKLRGVQLDSELGSSRLKRVRHYYIPEASSDVWPATLRLNAFFASNFETFGYFDPTAGWTRIAGTPYHELPIDVRLLLEDVVGRLRSVGEDKKRQTTLRAVRWCSTAVYWLTTEAVRELGRKLTPRTEHAAFHTAVAGEGALVEIVQEAEHTDEERFVYKMEIAVRAAIQERWMRKDPVGRAEAHHQIAHRLHSSMNDKKLLGVEFPIEPHWGRSRIHFLAECIRHLVRTCDQAHKPKSLGVCPREGAEDFPRAPTAVTRGCDPYEVINFCFGQLYWRELNGNGRSKQLATRKLALQHGAYHLTAELLQLMSEDQQLGKPHWALNQEYVSRYLREVGFARLDLGDLQGAKSAFEDLIELEGPSTQDPLDIIHYQLDLTVVLESMGNLSAAESTLTRAQAQFEAIRTHGGSSDERKIQQIKTRIRARRGHLAYLNGNRQEALEHCQYIEKHFAAALVRDVAHTYIAALSAVRDRPSLELAVKICVRQLFDNTSRGLHHEALGFRVALGRAFRKLDLLDAAESTLDGVYEDILQYGCSERTYLATLLEAGRVLYEQGRFVRAYAAYLRPCLDRAHARGFARVASRARKFAIECIEHLVATAPDGGWLGDAIERELQGRGDYLQQKRSRTIDPRSSFDPIATERWSPRLADRDALMRELSAIRVAIQPSNGPEEMRTSPLDLPL